jgi:hypothetical protein
LAVRRSIWAGTETVAARRPRASKAQRSPLLLRRINEVMREGRRGRTEAERIPFFCECERDDCYEPFWLSADAYDERRTEAQRPLILPGHEHERPETQPQRASLRELRSHPHTMDRGGAEKACEPRAQL